MLHAPSIALVVGLAALAGLMRPATAQERREPTTAPRAGLLVSATDGASLYGAYCAVCHGARAKGDGPAATALKAPPADLTTLARRRGGTFPREAVERAIAGAERGPVAHGTSDMPVWGPIFRALGDDRAQAAVRIASLARYIESLQVK